MAASKRQNLIDAIVERMKLIRTANGYRTELGERVEDWRVNYDEEDLPALSVCDMVAAIDLPNGNIDAPNQRHVLPVLLRIFQASDTRAADLRAMMADVVKAIGEDIYWKADGKALAMKTEIKKAGLVVPNENFEIGGAAVEIEITYLVKSYEF